MIIESGEKKSEFRGRADLNSNQLWDEICKPVLPERASKETIPDTLAARRLDRANSLIVLEHIHAALRSGVSREVMHHLIAAIRELERG